MTIELALSLAALFLAVAVVTVCAAFIVIDRKSPAQARLRAVAPGNAQGGLVLPPTGLTDKLDPFLQSLSRTLPRSPKDMGRVRRQLAGAGYYELPSAVIYSIAELALPILLAGMAILFLGFGRGAIFAVLAAIFGYLAPGLWLQHRTTQHKRAIQNGLPDALDLFIVCMEAGSSLDQAIVKASEELGITHPELTRELRLVTTEIRAGKPRLEAFKNFAKRTEVDDVRSLVAMLVQTDRFGTSVAQALRTHASNARIKRRQLAEERAAKVGVKLVFPLVLCLFPGVYLVCIGPVVVAIYRNL
jgi:tight adherence protein C